MRTGDPIVRADPVCRDASALRPMPSPVDCIRHRLTGWIRAAVAGAVLLIAGLPTTAGTALAATSAAAPAAVAEPAGSAAHEPEPEQAQKVSHPERAPLLAVTRAGARIVAVGDFGVVLLSDDDGQSWRQAQSVPTRRTLTAVTFIDDRNGWIIGHNGTVLHTSDAGESWRALTSPDPEVALFSVYFDNPQHGFVVGAFGFAARTADGGASWEPFVVTEEDPHLYQIFHDDEGTTWIAGEAGSVFRSTDGEDFESIDVPYSGSFWGGMKAPDGSLLLWGMSGTLLRSADHGQTWHQTKTDTRNSLTGASATRDGRIFLVGLSGTILTSNDDGATVTTEIRPDRRAYTSVIAVDGKPLLFSLEGTERSRQP